MEQDGKVSLWLGKTASKAALDQILLEVFNDDGDSTSQFMEAFHIDYIDPQFQEVFRYEALALNSKQSIFEGCSYIESFLGQIPETSWESYNSVILLYSFEYGGEVRSALNLNFVGSFDFSTNP